MIEASVHEHEFEHSDNPASNRITDEMLRFGAFLPKFGMSMKVIVALRHYFQIIEAIIKFVAIYVINCHPLLNLAYKGFCHQSVDIVACLFVVDAKDDVQIPATLSRANYGRPNGSERSRITSGIDAVAVGPHIPKIADFIAEIAFNLFPGFNHHTLPVYQPDSMAATGDC